MKTIYEYVINQKIKNTRNVAINQVPNLLRNSTHVIYIEKTHMTDDMFNPAYEIKAIYLLKAGGSNIGKEYGQPEFDDDEIDYQDIDGDWYESDGKNPSFDKYSHQNNVLKDFQKRSGIECCKKVNKARDDVYESKFRETNMLLTDLKNNTHIKIYDYLK